MSELSPDARAIIDAAHGGDDPTCADRRRVKAAVMSQIAALSAVAGSGAAEAATGAGSGSANAAGAVSGAAGATSASGGLVKLVIGALVVGGLGAGGWWLSRSPRSSPSGTERVVAVRADEPARPDVTPREAPLRDVHDVRDVRQPDSVTDRMIDGEATETARPDPAATPAVATAPAPRARERVRPDSRPAPATKPATKIDPAPAASTLAEEQAALERARDLLRAGDADAAYAQLEDHRSRFARGVLLQEREALRVFVLCRLGRTGDAREVADAFLARWPRSPQVPHIRSSCGGPAADSPAE